MTNLFIWGTLTTKVDGNGRDYFNDRHKKPIAERTIQGIEGEIYQVDDKELERLDQFERQFSYIKVEIEPQLFMYVLSPITDTYYWKNILRRK